MSEEKLAYSVEEVAALTGIGRTTLFSHMKSGLLKARKIGRRTIIPADELNRFVNEAGDPWTPSPENDFRRKQRKSA